MNFKRESQEDGFTLIELLVVILVIGILASIAIPVFLNQRKKASESSLKSDLKNTATIMETELVANKGIYPKALPTSVITSSGIVLSLQGGGANTGQTGDFNDNGDVRMNFAPFNPWGTLPSVDAQPTYIYARISDSGVLERQQTGPQFKQTSVSTIMMMLDITCKQGQKISAYGTINATYSASESFQKETYCKDEGGVLSASIAVNNNGTVGYYNLDKPVTITKSQPSQGNSSKFCIQGYHENNPSNVWKYDSSNGGLSEGKCL